MRSNILITTILIIFFHNQLNSQIIVPPIIEFNGLKENWLYISKDTNFVKSPLDKWSTPYWGHYPIDVYQDNKSILILENCAAQSPYGLIDGSLLHNVDLISGKLNWIFHNNSYVGLKHREDYLNSQIFINNENNIEIIGYKAIDTLDKNKTAFGFYANPVLKTINKNTGKLLTEKQGNYQGKSSHNATGLGGTALTRNSSNGFIHHGFYPELDSLGNEQLSFNIFKIMENMEIDSNITYSYKYKYEDNNNSTLFYFSNLTRLNHDTLILLFTTLDNTNLSNSPIEAKLIWLNIKDIDAIKVEKEIDITNEYYKPQDGTVEPFIQSVDNNIFVHQLMVPANPIVDAKWITWLLWLDKEGNKMANVPYIYNKSEKYGYVQVLGILEDNLYVSVSKQSNNSIGMDILKIVKGGNEAIKVGSISTAKTGEFEINNYNTIKMLPDNNILVGIGMDYNYSSDVKTQIQYYYSFKLDDLGIETATLEPQKYQTLKLYPVPTTNFIRVQTDQEYDEIIIKSMAGQSKIIDTNGKLIDMTNFSSGTYNIQLINNGKMIGNGRAIKL